MATFDQFPALDCKNCFRPIPLPPATRPDTLEGQGLWPKGGSKRNFLCPAYRHVKGLRRFTLSHLEVKSFDYMAALPGCVKHRAKKHLGLLGLMKKADEHRLCHAKSAASQQGEPYHRDGQNEGNCREEERNNCHMTL